MKNTCVSGKNTVTLVKGKCCIITFCGINTHYNLVFFFFLSENLLYDGTEFGLRTDLAKIVNIPLFTISNRD